MTTTATTGDGLPSIGLRASDGYLLNLRSFVTKQPVVFLFFGAPTLEGAARRRGVKAIQALAAGHDRLREAGVAVVGVSCDSEEEQAEFIAQEKVPFLLFSDERRTAASLLGLEMSVDGTNANVTKPTAIVADREGSILARFEAKPDDLVERVLAAVAEPMPPMDPAATESSGPTPT